MNQPPPPADDGAQPAPDGPPRPQHLSARVPDGVGGGVFSTGVIVLTGATEFTLDFIQNIGQPANVTARVVMPHATLPQFVEALRKNLEMYSQRFGMPPEMPKPPAPERPLSAQELYDELKLRDELLSGASANGVMIGHTAAEFKLDFITNLFPHSAVSSRVFLAAPQIPRLIESLDRTYQQFVQQVQRQQQQRGQLPPDGRAAPPSTEQDGDKPDEPGPSPA